MNLKTLKDICDDDWYEDEDIYNIDANEVVDKTKEALKQEAIKWVKSDDATKLELGIEHYEIGGFDKGLIHIFNITQEDLE